MGDALRLWGAGPGPCPGGKDGRGGSRARGEGQQRQESLQVNAASGLRYQAEQIEDTAEEKPVPCGLWSPGSPPRKPPGPDQPGAAAPGTLMR